MFYRPPSGQDKETLGDVVSEATVKALQEVSQLLNLSYIKSGFKLESAQRAYIPQPGKRPYHPEILIKVVGIA